MAWYCGAEVKIMNAKSITWLAVFLIVLIWSSIDPLDRVTWWLEVLPAILGLALLALTRRRFPLTPLLYVLILVHAVILMVGGHYTYAEVPLGDWLQSLSGSERNDYDKLGHFAQGFIPAVLAREILVRNQVIAIRAWLGFVVVSICLGFSAFYELLEWAAALASKEGAEAFLGTQGYEWDTQSDMWWALCGAVLALFILSAWHDRQIAALENAGS
jgi:putative membrane protein